MKFFSVLGLKVISDNFPSSFFVEAIVYLSEVTKWDSEFVLLLLLLFISLTIDWAYKTKILNWKHLGEEKDEREIE